MQELIQSLVKEIANTCETEPLLARDRAHRIPQRDKIIYVIKELRKVIFPGYFCEENDDFFVGYTLNNIWHVLMDQLEIAYSLVTGDAEEIREKSLAACTRFFRRIPYIQKMLLKDVEAIFEGDPAAHGREEIIFSYPGIFAIYIYRAAHELYVQNVPFIPRIMTEYAHSGTGIDINAGATIGEYFFIDHGTGIVIGETCEIGNHVKLYQGVTLGAISTRSGQMLSGKKRHPTIEDNVTIYSNASILGGDTVIGENATIGGNTFITWSVPKNTLVTRETPPPADHCAKKK